MITNVVTLPCGRCAAATGADSKPATATGSAAQQASGSGPVATYKALSSSLKAEGTAALSGTVNPSATGSFVNGTTGAAGASPTASSPVVRAAGASVQTNSVFGILIAAVLAHALFM